MKKFKKLIWLLCLFILAGCTATGAPVSGDKTGDNILDDYSSDYLLMLSIAAQKDDNYIQEIHIVDALSGQSNAVAEDDGIFTGPKWSNDGTKIAYSTGGQPGENSQNIKIIDNTGIEIQNIVDLGGDETVIGWSSDDKQLLVQSLYQDEEIYYTQFYLVDIQSSKATLVGDFMEDSFKSIQYSEWSPDQRYVIFSATTDDGQSSIYKLDIESGDLLRLTRGYYDDMPKWSPDGKSIVFMRQREDSAANANKKGKSYEYNPSTDIWLADAEGYEFRCIAKEDFTDHLDAMWSPDGNSILYTRSSKANADKNQVVVYNINDKKEKTLTDSNGYKYMSRFSSDGKKVAYISFKGNLAEEVTDQSFESWVYILDVETGKSSKLCVFNGDIYTLEWRP